MPSKAGLYWADPKESKSSKYDHYRNPWRWSQWYRTLRLTYADKKWFFMVTKDEELTLKYIFLWCKQIEHYRDQVHNIYVFYSDEDNNNDMRKAELTIELIKTQKKRDRYDTVKDRKVYIDLCNVFINKKNIFGKPVWFFGTQHL